MRKAPVTNLRSKRQQPKASLLERLNKPLRDFVSDFEAHGASTLEKVREQNPEKYLELATKLASLVATLKTEADGFKGGEDSHEAIARDLLKTVGFTDPDDAAIQEAIKLNEQFIAQLESIRNQAQGGLN
jgi:hypothetical protein